MQKINLYRRRFIPNEKILLDDKIILVDNDVIITQWNVIRPKKNFSSGRSCVFIDEGFKISKLYDENGRFAFVYCDIVNVIINKPDYIVEDLLADVIIENDGMVKVLDLDEIAQALDNNLITVEMAKDALKKTNRLLSFIYNGNFDKFMEF